MKGNRMMKSGKFAERLGEERYNKQGYLMKIVKYDGSKNIIIEFQDKYKARIHTQYSNFKAGIAKNPYCPEVFDVGIIGNKYKSKEKGKTAKEYSTWLNILQRCFNNKTKEKQPAYADVTCCEEWLYYENFYEWLHAQPNFDKWYKGERWAVDKDILKKGNKVYSPENCVLVPIDINNLFVKQSGCRSELPIGVRKNNEKFQSCCCYLSKCIPLGTYDTSEQAFQSYKTYKESLIKQIAQDEFSKGNITEKCYNAMMNYIVEITD